MGMRDTFAKVLPHLPLVLPTIAMIFGIALMIESWDRIEQRLTDLEAPGAALKCS